MYLKMYTGINYKRRFLFFLGVILLFLNANRSIAQCAVSVSVGNDTTVCQGAKFIRAATIIGTGATTIKKNKKGSSAEMVFERTNVPANDPSKGWDGRIRGVVQGQDVYGYVVEVLCDDGTPFFYKGNVTLLK